MKNFILKFQFPKIHTGKVNKIVGAVPISSFSELITNSELEANPRTAKTGRVTKDIEETQGAAVKFPIIADSDRTVADLYDMIHPNADNTATVRSVFIIDPNKKVRLTLTYPASCGRNFDEIVRVIDALQLSDEYNVATPVDWKDGDDVIIPPSVKNEDIPANYPKGHTEIKPYLRTTPAPNK